MGEDRTEDGSRMETTLFQTLSYRTVLKSSPLLFTGIRFHWGNLIPTKDARIVERLVCNTKARRQLQSGRNHTQTA